MIAGKGYLFPDASYPKFRRTMKDVKPDLPDGQATHALRHSFATHFMITAGVSSPCREYWGIHG